jgi:hypothetical protein
MSDYEVTLVNDNMQEFYIRFHGPEDSKGFLSMPSFVSFHAPYFPDAFAHL